jgi:hypothetical protein
MLRQRHLPATLAIFATLALAGSTVRADDRAAARALFEEGRRLMKAGDVADACPKFEAAAHLTQTSGVRLNLAVCWEKLGRTASAWAMYDEARVIAERSGDASQLDLALKGKAALEPKLSRILVSVPAASLARDLQVTRDGEPVLSGAWGVGVPVDPGPHQIAASAPGRKAWSTKIDVAAGAATLTVMVPVLEPEAPKVAALPPPEPRAPVTTGQPATQPPAPVDTQSTSGSSGSTQRLIGAVAAGVGVVGLGVGSYFGIKTASDKSTYQAHEANGQCIDLTCQTVSHNAASEGNISTVLFIAGGVVLAGGAVLWLTAPRAHEGAVTAKIVPAVGTRTAGLSLEGSW